MIRAALRWTALSKSQLLQQQNVVRRNLYLSASLLQTLRAKQAEPQAQGCLLKVTWDNEAVNHYPYVYLRDHCTCPLCYHSSSQQRLLHMKNLDVDVTASEINVSTNDGQVSIKWSDGHASKFDSNWLFSRRLPEGSEATNTRLLSDYITPWDNTLSIPRFSFEPMMRDQHFLLDWLQAMKQYGVAILTDVPRTRGQIERLGDAVGFLRRTFYGDTCSLRSEPGARSLAYTSYELQPHTDLPYYEFKPSVILLHCIDQVRSEGGENTFVDGYHIAEIFKAENPKAFELMTSTRVLHRIKGVEPCYGEFEQLFPRPIIELDVRGQVRRINFNDPLREEFLDTPADKLGEVYRAYHALTRMFYDPRFIVRNKMSVGDMCTIDNDRLLHGRTSFEVRDDDPRWLEQAYIDWDILNSKINVLTNKLK